MMKFCIRIKSYQAKLEHSNLLRNPDIYIRILSVDLCIVYTYYGQLCTITRVR